MSDDNQTTPTSNGKPLVGLVTERGSRPPLEQKKRPTSAAPRRATEYQRQDPLDEAANVRGCKPVEMMPEVPTAAGIYDAQILTCILGRVEGGPWSHQFVGENIRSATFSSVRRAEAVMGWLRRKASADGTPVEYMIIPLLHGETGL